MAAQLVSNNAYSTLNGAINDSVLSLAVQTGHGARFPIISGGDFFYCTLQDALNNIEIVKVTARTGDTFTIERNQESSGAKSWASATTMVELRFTAATTVTTDGAQTLTNKTMVAPILGTPTSGDLANCTGLPVAGGGTGAGSFTSGGLLRGNGTSPLSIASAADIVAALGSTAVTNATNAANVAVTAQSAAATYQLMMTASTTSGNAVASISSATKPVTYDPSTGNLTAAGNITAYSDERLKANWRGYGLSDFVAALAGVKSGVYDRTDGGGTQVGVSAQSLQQVLPDAVVKGDGGMLSVSYGNAALAACVELAKEVVRLRTLIGEKL